jgi:polyhydroxybutyrate depolymerase
VVNLHGATGTAESQDDASAFPSLAEREGFVVLTPEAAEPGRLWNLPPVLLDVRYVSRLIDDTMANQCIDPARVYLAGFSQGGMLATAVACEQPERFAAIGSVAGLYDLPSCERTTSVPMVALQGTADPTVRPDGTYSDDIQAFLKGPVTSREELARRWATQNGCSSDPPATSTEGLVTVLTFDCPTDGEVLYYRVDGATHLWPSTREQTGPVTVPTTPGDSAVDATDVMWTFFERVGG